MSSFFPGAAGRRTYGGAASGSGASASSGGSSSRGGSSHLLSDASSMKGAVCTLAHRLESKEYQAETCFVAIKESQQTISVDCALLRELVLKHKSAKQQAYQFIRSKIVVHQGQVQSIEQCNEMMPGVVKDMQSRLQRVRTDADKDAGHFLGSERQTDALKQRLGAKLARKERVDALRRGIADRRRADTEAAAQLRKDVHGHGGLAAQEQAGLRAAAEAEKASHGARAAAEQLEQQVERSARDIERLQAKRDADRGARDAAAEENRRARAAVEDAGAAAAAAGREAERARAAKSEIAAKAGALRAAAERGRAELEAKKAENADLEKQAASLASDNDGKARLSDRWPISMPPNCSSYTTNSYP